MSDANPTGRPGRSEPSREQQGRGTEGDLDLGASSTTGNEGERGTPFAEDAAGGSRLGAASGVDSIGTAGAPPATLGDGDGPMETDVGPARPGAGMSRTVADAHVGPTHPPTGADTTRTTGGFVQHPNEPAPTMETATGGGGPRPIRDEREAGDDAFGSAT